MSFLEKVKKTVTSVAKVSSRESKKFYDITKLKLEITHNKNKEKVLFKEIGLLAYKAHKKGKSITKRIRPKLEEIDALEDTITVLREQIELIQNTDDLEYEGYEEYTESVEEYEEDADVEVEIVEEESEDEEELETEPIDPVE